MKTNASERPCDNNDIGIDDGKDGLQRFKKNKTILEPTKKRSK